MGELGSAVEKQPIGWAAGYTGIMNHEGNLYNSHRREPFNIEN